jgi:hypothetical protein
MHLYLCLQHGCYSSTESTGEPDGTWTADQSILWSLLEILLEMTLYSLLESLLVLCITEQCSWAAPEGCTLWEELSFPHNAFGWWKHVSWWMVWHECSQIESTCLSPSGTMITITNTIIITIITMAIISLQSSLSAPNWMCTNTHTICSLWVADCARYYESQDPIFYFFDGIQNCDCQYHDCEAFWDLIAMCTVKIRFTLWY